MTAYGGETPRFYGEHRWRPCAALVRQLVDSVGLDRSAQVVDVGSGPGTVALALAGTVGHVTAIDIESDMLAEARRRAAAAGLTNTTWLCADAHQVVWTNLGEPACITFGTSFHWMQPHNILLERIAADVPASVAVVVIASEAVPNPPERAAIGALWSLLDHVAPGPSLHSPAGSLTEHAATLRSSPFSEVDTIRVEVSVEPLDVGSAVGFLYSHAWVLDRLGDRRTAFESAARDLLGPILGNGTAAPTRRTDVALIARRPRAWTQS
ncbi:MAG: class I SAM-dependent methyltransferase [Ilumatobacteraceae bacterium]